MRTLNVRLAAVLAVIVVVLAAGTFFLHKYQIVRSARVFKSEADQFLAQAEEAKKKKDTDTENEAHKSAIKNLKWFVQLKPAETDSMEKLGLLMADQAKDSRAFSEAYATLNALLRIEPERQTARRRVVEMALAARLYGAAKENLQELLAHAPKDEQSELYELLGRCRAEAGEFDAAVKDYRKAIELSPTAVEAYLRLAAILRSRLGTRQEADQLMEKLVTANPKSARAHFLRADYLGLTQANDEAFKECMTALALAPDDREILLQAVACYGLKKDFPKARECAEKAKKLYPDDVNVYLAISQLEIDAGARDKSLEALLQGLKTTKRDPQLLWRLAVLRSDNREFDAAQQVIQELRNSPWQLSERRAIIDYLVARIELSKENYRVARDSLERIRPALGRWPLAQAEADVALAQCYGQEGNRDKQVTAYLRALDIDGRNVRALVGLADALVSQGKVSEALNVYGRLARIRKVTPPMLIFHIQMLVRLNLTKPEAERDWTSVDKMVDELQKLDPNAYQVPLLRAQILGQQNKDAEAAEVLKKAIEEFPKNELLKVQLARLSKDQKEVDTLIQQIQETSGDTVEERLLRAQNAVRQMGAKAEEELLKLSENTGQFSNQDRSRLWLGLVSVATENRNLSMARKLCRHIADKEPDNFVIRQPMFDLAYEAGDEATMEAILKDVERIAGQGPFWLCGQAMLLTFRAQDPATAGPMLAEALKKLAQAREMQPSWSRLPWVMAVIYDRQGKTDEALEAYLDAVKMGERNPAPIRRAVQLLFRKQRFTQADRWLRDLEKQQVPFNEDMNRAAAEIALQTRDFDRALEKARKVTATGFANSQEYVWQGEVLNLISLNAKSEGRAKEADDLAREVEKSLRRALELDPKNPAMWSALIRFLSGRGQEAEAEKAITEGKAKVPAKELTAALAQWYEAVKKNESAQAQYEVALAAAPNDPNTVRAVADFYCRNGNVKQGETLLRRIIDEELKSSEDDVNWARRQMALLLAQRGGYKNLEQARELIEKNLNSAGSSSHDRRAKATLDTMSPRKARRDEAIGTFEGMIRDETATAEDRYQLAQLYLSAGAYDKAFPLLRSLIAADSKGYLATYLATYISALLENKQISSASDQLGRLEKIDPNRLVTVALRAETLVAKNEADQALQLLRAFVEKPGALPADRSMRINGVAEKLESLAEVLKKRGRNTMADAFLQEAESLYGTYVDLNPGSDWMIVAYCARQGRIDEAIELLERTWDSQSPPVLAQVASFLMREGGVGTEQLQSLARIVQKSMERTERPIPLLITLADIYGLQDRGSDAEGLYRQVLQKSPGNVQAMNNLAVLLALQGVKLDEALVLINKGIEVAGPLGALLDSRAVVYLGKGELQKAEADLKEALADEETPVRLFHQAQLYDKLGQSDNVTATMDKALKKGLTKQMLQPPEYAAFEKFSVKPAK